MDLDEDYDASSDESDDAKMGDGISTRKKSSRGFTDTKAAIVLMKLKTQADLFKSDLQFLKRRRSY